MIIIIIIVVERNNLLVSSEDVYEYDVPSDHSSAAPTKDLKQALANSPHQLKLSQLKKGDTCAVCAKIFTSFFLKQGYKCVGELVLL